jgi:antitoxin component YwqK of YwqJK toxin-antitoxin module
MKSYFIKRILRSVLHIIALHIISFLFGCDFRNSKEGLVRSYHKNGKIFSEIFYENGMKNGVFKTWYDNGQLHDSAFFKNDSLVGIAISYYSNGNKNSLNYYNEKHELDGESFFWYENGVLGGKSSYVNGKLHGDDFIYYENGRKKEISKYNLGVLDGLRIYFKDNGDTLKQEFFKNGKLIEVIN